MRWSDLTTFVVEGAEGNLAVSESLADMQEAQWLEPFPDGRISHDVSYLMGRDAFELLIYKDHRSAVLATLAQLHYICIEGA